METNLNAGVYCIINIINNKKYMGSSSTNIKNRWAQHKSKLRRGCHENPRLQNAWNKYGENAFDFRVLIYTEPDEALALEQWILDNYFDLFEYNISRDAIAPMLGRKHTDEAKRKISEKEMGKIVSEETRKKLSEGKSGENNPNFGKTLSEEHKSKIIEANSGKHPTDETRAKMSKANIGKHYSEATREKMSDAKSGNKCYRWINIPKEEIMEMQSLRAQGYSYEKIADIFGISDSTVRNRLNKISSAMPMKQEVSREANL